MCCSLLRKSGCNLGYSKPLSLSSISVITGTKDSEADSYYKDRHARHVQTNLQKKITNREADSLFSPLFLDKYLISGTLMGID